MLLRQFVENRGGDLLVVGQRRRVRGREIFFVERKRGFVDRFLGLLEIGAGRLHQIFHRHVGSEREAELLPELVRADPEIAGGTRQQIVSQPSLVVAQGRDRLLLERREIDFCFRRLVERLVESFLDQRHGALRLIDRRLGINPRRIFQVRLGLRDDRRNLFQPGADCGRPLLCRRKIARDQEIETVGEALVIKKRIPFALLELFDAEDFVVDILLKQPHIDFVRAR